MKKIYLFFIGLVICFNSQSQVSQFNDSSMYGGRIRSYAKNTTCLLVATEGGIFKTTNQGQSWTNATLNFDPNSVSCRKIVNIDNNFYAMSDNNSGPNIYKSIDNGSNWNQLSFTTWWPQSLGKISNILYAIGGNNTGGYLYSSTDGNSWTQKAMLWDNNWQGGNCELLSFNQNKIYVLYNNNLYFTSDGNTIDTVKTTGLASSGFNNDKRLYGDAFGNLYYNENDAIFKYNFTSKTWSDISTGKIATGFGIMDFSVTDNAIFAIAMNNTLGMKLYRSTNQGNTFSELASTGLVLPMIGNIIEVSTTNFIGNWLDERILISSNGGNTWTSTNNQYIASSSANITLSGNNLLFSRDVRGLILSNNQGASWNVSNNGIPGFSGIAYFVNEIAQVKDTLFSFCRPDPNSDLVALYKSTNNGNSWISAPIPAPYNAGEEYLFSGKCDSALFVSYYDVGSSQYALIVSFNNAGSWSKPNSSNSSSPIYLKGPKNCLFAFYAQSNYDWEDFTNVSKANNFGASFTDINTDNLFNNNFLIKRIFDNSGNKGNAMMDFDAANNIAIFVVKDRTMGNGTDRLYQYDISTTTWSEITTNGLPSNYLANNIKYVGNNVWLLATTTGLYKSIDAGANWIMTHNAASWQNGIIVNCIQMIGNKAFLGTLANGVWVADIALGILEQLKDNDLQIFPNPTSDIINIMIPDFNGKTATVSLFGLDGREIVNNTINKNQFQLDMKNFALGSYVVVIKSNNNIYSKTIIRK